MTRRRKKTAAARKRKSKSRPKSEPRADQLDDFITAGARSLGLTIDKSWMPAVRAHLQVALAHGARVAGFTLPDDAEPAPVFEA